MSASSVKAEQLAIGHLSQEQGKGISGRFYFIYYIHSMAKSI